MRESKHFNANQLSLKEFSRVGWNLVHCWDLFVWWASHSFCLGHSIFKGENPYSCDLVGLYSDIFKQTSFKLGMMVENTKFYILIAVWITLKFSPVSCVHFSKISLPIRMKFGMLHEQYSREKSLHTSRLVSSRLCPSTAGCSHLSMSSIVCIRDFMKYAPCVGTLVNLFVSNLAWCQSTTKLNSLIPVWIALMLSSGQSLMGKLELVRPFCCKVEANQMYVMVDHVKDTNLKKML